MVTTKLRLRQTKNLELHPVMSSVEDRFYSTLAQFLPDESNEGAAEVPDWTVEDTMAVTVPVKWHT